jgi:hypothetical protein
MQTAVAIDLSDLPPGVYFVRLEGEKGMKTGKFARN